MLLKKVIGDLHDKVTLITNSSITSDDVIRKSYLERKSLRRTIYYLLKELLNVLIQVMEILTGIKLLLI